MATGKDYYKNHGNILLGGMLVLFITSLTLCEAANLWNQKVQRDREIELLKIGEKYREAIREYYLSTPDTVKTFPKNLDDLTFDSRFSKPKRHLRKLYKDPITQRDGWGIINGPGNGIMGIFSLSQKKPFKIKNFPESLKIFENKSSYSDWTFTYNPDAEFISLPQ